LTDLKRGARSGSSPWSDHPRTEFLRIGCVTAIGEKYLVHLKNKTFLISSPWNKKKRNGGEVASRDPKREKWVQVPHLNAEDFGALTAPRFSLGFGALREGKKRRSRLRILWTRKEF